MGYLKKDSEQSYVVTPNLALVAAEYQKIKIKLGFGGQYSHSQENINPQFPDPLLGKLTIYIFADANHPHDKKREVDDRNPSYDLISSHNMEV